MTATREEIGARIDALAAAYEGDEFVAAVARLADEVGPDAKHALQEALLERAAAEEEFQEAIRQRAAAKGWTRRMLGRLDHAQQDEQATRVAAAIQAGADGSADLEGELESLRRNRGRAAVVLDELSRNPEAAARAWVAGPAVEILGEDASRLVLSLTRDKAREVREAAITALVSLGPDAVRPALPYLRRRLRSKDVTERVSAMRSLGEAGDTEALAAIEERATSAEATDERQEAAAAAAILRAVGT
ncbi:MAG: HEAT repeat domain-containing protein [Gaiellaceae bacterium]